MTAPRIPDHLLIFDPADWPGREPGQMISIDALIRREQWRRAQDQWGHEHGIWREEFERLRRDQLAERERGAR